MTNKKGKRGIAITVEDLMQSVRLKIAVQNFETDPMLLKAILTEFALELFSCTKNTVIKRYNTFSGLTQESMLPLLRSIAPDEVLNANVFWNLSPIEIQLYLAEKNGMPKEERTKLLEKLRVQFMESV